MRTVSATPLVPAVANVGTIIAIDAQIRILMLIIIQLSIFRLFKTDWSHDPSFYKVKSIRLCQIDFFLTIFEPTNNEGLVVELYQKTFAYSYTDFWYYT